MAAHKLPGISFLLLALSVLPQAALGLPPSPLTLAVSPNPSTFGAPVTLSATVTPSNATGRVTFYDGVTVLGTRTIAGGSATFLTRLLPSGSRNLRAYYAGDSGNAAATSNVVTQMVNAGPSTGFATGSTPLVSTQVAVGDFNGDGIADLATANAGAITILIGQGDGTFQAMTTNPAIVGFPVAVADFDGDGKADLVVQDENVATGSLYVLRGNGDGTFQAGVSIAPAATVVVGDFNADGNPDLAIATTAGVNILIGNGDGTFQPGVVYAAGPNPGAITALAPGDFNGDGKTDLAVSLGQTVNILLNNGDGTFQPAASTSPYVTLPSSIVVADLNQDGKADLVIISSQNRFWVQIGNGDGTFAGPVTYAAGFVCANAGGVCTAPPVGVVADFNGDGIADVALGNALPLNAGSNVSILQGVGDGTFLPPVNYQTNSPSFLIAADFNNDGKTDLLTGGSLLLGATLNLTATGGTPQSTSVGTAFASALQVKVTDTLGNPASGITVTFTAPAAGASASLSSASAVTNAAGIASVTPTANNTAGSYTVVASVETLSAPFSLTNTATAAASITATGGTPQSAAVGAPFPNALQATVKDALGNPVSGVTVTFAAPATGASATLSSTTATTNASGVASVTATANSISGNYSVTASAGSLSSAFLLTNTPASAVTITATGGTPQSATVGTAFTNALQATVTDSLSNPVSGVTVTFTAPATGASANLSGAVAVTNASGIASVTATANATPGNYSVTASAGTVSAAFVLTNTVGQPASVTATGGTPQSAPAGIAFANALQATVKDSLGNPVNGVTVTFAAPATGASATLSSTTGVTNAAGVASVTATANSTPGNYSVTASVGNLSSTFSLTNTVGQPATIAATGGTPQSATVGTGFANALQATVRDTLGNPVVGATVTFGAPGTGASATLSSTTAVTNAAGVASVTATANATPGTYSVTAGLGNLSSGFSLTNTVGQPASILATGGTPQSAALGTGFANALQAIVKDTLGNPVSGATVTFSAPATGASATLSSNTAVTNASGVASVTATANATPGNYSVTASLGTFSSTFSLTNTAGQPASILATGGTPQSATVGVGFANALQATVKDTLGNPVSGATVTFTAPATGASATLSSATAATNAAGVASITATANATPGNYFVTASVGTFSATFSLTNTVGQPANVLATGGTPQSAGLGMAFANALQATVKDTLGNPVSGATVTFAAPATGASATLSSNTAVTNTSGMAFVTATANTTPGNYSVTATVGTSSASFALVNTAGQPASVTVTGGSPQSATVGTGFANALLTTVKDSAGNPVSGVTVMFAAPGTGASAVLSSTAALTNAAGVAGVTATANGITGSYTVTASVGTLSAPFQLINTQAPPASIMATGGTPQSTLSGSAFPNPLQATVRDSGGNPVSGVTVTFAAPTTGASTVITSATAVTNVFGVASLPATANGVAGNYMVTASVGSLGTFFSLTNLAGGSSNLALGKIATQSSTLTGDPTAGAQAAVDGNTNGSFFGGSVTATNADLNAWWEVDLGASATVSSVVIFNRTDCCSSRLSDYWVFISATPFLATDTLATLESRAGIFSSHQTTSPNPSATIAAGGAQGRYVRVQLSDTDYLSLAEVQVFGTGGAPPPTNLALGKVASQSSTLPGAPTAGPGAAVDGNTDGNFFDGSVTATNLDSNAWWQVDLGASAAVSSVVVWNRTDCCSSRLGDYWVFISDTPFLATDTPNTLQNRAGTFASHQTSASLSTTIAAGAQGRYVRVQLTGMDYLSLAEVQVFGTGGAPAANNLALNKAASQSSTLPGSATAVAASAVDGNTDGNFFDGSVTATNLDPNPWWQVDLGASANVSSVVVWNRADCCGARLSDYWVFISDTPFLDTDTPATLQGRAGTFASHQTVAPNLSTSVIAGAGGRYVRVQLTNANYLSLAEVQVFGQ